MIIMTLEATTKSLEQYWAFQRLAKKLVKGDIDQEDYLHLRKNYSQQNNLDIKDYRTTVNFIARPTGLEETGKGEMVVGRSQTIVEIIADFNEVNFNSGFYLGDEMRFNEDRRFRVLVGANLAYDEILNKIKCDISASREIIFGALQTGDYKTFIHKTLRTIDNAIDNFKRANKYI
jgi:hypothetical protein